MPAQYDQYLAGKEKERISQRTAEHDTAKAERKRLHDAQCLKHYAAWSKMLSGDFIETRSVDAEEKGEEYQSASVASQQPTARRATPTDAGSGDSARDVLRPARNNLQPLQLAQRGKRPAGDVFHPAEIKRLKTGNSDSSEGAATMPQVNNMSTKADVKTISFAEVYQDGKARYKHIIVEFQPGSKKFYILKCDEHGVHFNQNPLAGAAKHLNSVQHGQMSKERHIAIQFLGYRSSDCTEDLMYKNNEHVLKAFSRGYKPLNMNQLSKSERLNLGLPLKPPAAAAPAGIRTSGQTVMPAHPSQLRGVPSPIPGELYLAYWAQEKRDYVVMILPWGDLSCAGIPGGLQETGLMDCAPKCYVFDRATERVIGWSPGYEDGGHLVMRREFPVMYFDGKRCVRLSNSRRYAVGILLTPCTLAQICWVVSVKGSVALRVRRPEPLCDSEFR